MRWFGKSRTEAAGAPPRRSESAGRLTDAPAVGTPYDAHFGRCASDILPGGQAAFPLPSPFPDHQSSPEDAASRLTAAAGRQQGRVPEAWLQGQMALRPLPLPPDASSTQNPNTISNSSFPAFSSNSSLSEPTRSITPLHAHHPSEKDAAEPHGGSSTGGSPLMAYGSPAGSSLLQGFASKHPVKPPGARAGGFGEHLLEAGAQLRHHYRSNTHPNSNQDSVNPKPNNSPNQGAGSPKLSSEASSPMQGIPLPLPTPHLTPSSSHNVNPNSAPSLSPDPAFSPRGRPRTSPEASPHNLHSPNPVTNPNSSSRRPPNSNSAQPSPLFATPINRPVPALTMSLPSRMGLRHIPVPSTHSSNSTLASNPKNDISIPQNSNANRPPQPVGYALPLPPPACPNPNPPPPSASPNGPLSLEATQTSPSLSPNQGPQTLKPNNPSNPNYPQLFQSPNSATPPSNHPQNLTSRVNYPVGSTAGGDVINGSAFAWTNSMAPQQSQSAPRHQQVSNQQPVYSPQQQQVYPPPQQLYHRGGSPGGASSQSSPPGGTTYASPSRGPKVSNCKKYEPPLGSGSFGVVYKCFNKETGALFAVKQVPISGSHFLQHESLRQLKQEIAVMSQLQHPNIVQYIGTDMDENNLYIFLEYMPGGSVHRLLEECGKLQEPVLRMYTAHILAGLAYLHAKKTVHRDIKGANLLVDTNGQVKLADFGMAKHMRMEDFTRSYEKGSSYWMAPEVLIPSPRGYDLAVDIWSLGCTVLEMATGKPPWWPLQGIQAMFKIANSWELPQFPNDLSEEGRDFITRCLQRDPSARPTASKLLEHPFICNVSLDAEASAASLIQQSRRLSLNPKANSDHSDTGSLFSQRNQSPNVSRHSSPSESSHIDLDPEANPNPNLHMHHPLNSHLSSPPSSTRLDLEQNCVINLNPNPNSLRSHPDGSPILRYQGSPSRYNFTEQALTFREPLLPKSEPKHGSTYMGSPNYGHEGSPTGDNPSST